MPPPRTALVTGSAGFVGRHFTNYLLDRGWQVRAVDIADPVKPLDALDLFADDDHRFDLVIHAAASSPYRAAIDAEPWHFPRNVELDSSMFTWASRTKPGRVVYLSSSAAYPRAMQEGADLKRRRLDEADVSLYAKEPDAVYGWTKLTGERMAQACRGVFPITVVRPFSGYGEDQTEQFPFGAIVERARRQEDPLKVRGSGDQVRDFIHIDDIVEAIMVMVRDNFGGPVNLCTGIGTSISTLAHIAAQIAGYRPTIHTDSGRGNEGVHHRVGDPTLLHTMYYPRVSLAQGIARRLELS